MSELLLQGLTISFIGISLTFAALGLLILAIIVLRRLFPVRKEEDTSASAESAAPGIPMLTTEEVQIVAAIAIALAYLRSLDSTPISQDTTR